MVNNPKFPSSERPLFNPVPAEQSISELGKRWPEPRPTSNSTLSAGSSGTDAVVDPSDDKLLIGSNIQIYGMIDNQTLLDFMKQLGEVRAANEDLILELMTNGGEADVARRIALEIRLFQSRGNRRAFCVGKTVVYSAGITILSAFECPHRFLTSDTTLLIHERHLEKTLNLNGPIKATQQIVREELAALQAAERVEREDFEHFVRGSGMSADDLFEKAKENCYLSAQQALDLKLVARILA